MATPIPVFGIKGGLVITSVTHHYSLPVLTAQHLHSTNPVTPVAGYTPPLIPWAIVKNVSPLPGGSAGGGTVGYAF